MKRIEMILITVLVAVLFAGCAPRTQESSKEKTAEAVDFTSQASAAIDESGLYKLPVIDPKAEKETEQSFDVVVIGAGGGGFFRCYRCGLRRS